MLESLSDRVNFNIIHRVIQMRCTQLLSKECDIMPLLTKDRSYSHMGGIAVYLKELVEVRKS